MFFDWFDTKEAALLGVKLADNLYAELSKANTKKSSKKIDHSVKAMEKIRGQLNTYQQQKKLNFLKKSKLANEFRWRLMEIGYQEDFADSVTKQLLFQMK